MQSNIGSFVKLVEKKGQVLTYQDTSFIKVTQYCCSTFINKNVLVKGEWGNNNSKNRNAMIVLFDCDTGQIIGESKA